MFSEIRVPTDAVAPAGYRSRYLVVEGRPVYIRTMRTVSSAAQAGSRLVVLILSQAHFGFKVIPNLDGPSGPPKSELTHYPIPA
jgi:hypothetical protein